MKNNFDQEKATKNKKLRPDQTAGQGKGLWAEASFGLDFSYLFDQAKR
jgi:hypothetical protein